MNRTISFKSDDHAMAWLIRILNFLRRFEWAIDEVGWSYCPTCLESRNRGHAINCEMVSVLASTPEGIENALRDFLGYKVATNMAARTLDELLKCKEALRKFIDGAPR